MTDPIDPKFKEFMNNLAKGLDDILNGAGCPSTKKQNGFTIFIYPFNDGPKEGRMNYISNAESGDFIVALKEMLAHLEGRKHKHESKQ